MFSLTQNVAVRCFENCLLTYFLLANLFISNSEIFVLLLSTESESELRRPTRVRVWTDHFHPPQASFRFNWSQVQHEVDFLKSIFFFYIEVKTCDTQQRVKTVVMVHVCESTKKLQ